MDRLKTILIALSLPALLAASSVHAGEGTDVAWLMSYYYNRTPTDCGAGRPLDQCSGLRLRGTDSGQAFEPWDPSPNSVKSGGVSMSFLRKDVKYKDLGLKKTNGFVLKPNDFISQNEKKISTLCFFPLDAWTDYRTNAGCSENSNTTNYVEKICQDAGVKTAEQWLADYRRVNNDHQKQCGFEIKDRADDAESFWQGVRARQMVQNDRDAMETQSEIRVPPWGGAEEVAQLPVLAFIYTPNPGLPSGLEKARGDQKRYFQKTVNGSLLSGPTCQQQTMSTPASPTTRVINTETPQPLKSTTNARATLPAPHGCNETTRLSKANPGRCKLRPPNAAGI
ncbi:hypothetical protein RX810_05915 [Pseudomonas syringae pv. actinidiae]|nr:hypothetical protein [Pseudomonas syringae pv. actinidiae]